MGKGEKQMLRDAKQEDQWVIMEGDDDDTYNTISSMSSLEDSTTTSNGSSYSSDMVDDASSSTSTSNGPLYELSELMAQLPIKRGLSKYYQGKSQSFTSLSRVRGIEDLAKKETPYRRKMKACKSYGGGLDTHKSYSTLPKATISKKASRGSLSLSLLRRRGSFIGTCKLASFNSYTKKF